MKTHPYFTSRSAGVLLHVSSLPGGHGIGDFGPGAHRFLDWLQASGWNTWQVLPIGPLGKGDSPYSSPSSFAIEPLLISIDGLVKEGLLPASAARSKPELRRGGTKYRLARLFKEPRLLEAFENFQKGRRARSRLFLDYLEQADQWLGPWCRWATEHRGGTPEFHAFVQFKLEQQWSRLRRAAHARRIRIFGDLPIFVPLESADVEADPRLFLLDRSGRPTMVTGVPPDQFSRQGQLWGHPQYRWPEHARTNFEWWGRRLAAQFDRFDIVRIDHFVGLQKAWHVKAGSRSARTGTWRRTPGREMLQAFQDRFGQAALVAEDLGAVTPAVRRLRDDFGLPGMTLLQNAFDRDDDSSLPHNLRKHSVVYTGTHDNDTTNGWWRSLPSRSRQRVRDYAGPVGTNPSEALIRLALASGSRTAIIPMQDVLGLGRSARMNKPGVPSGNWRWRLQMGMIRKRDAARLRRLASATGRLDGRGRTPNKTP